METGYSRTSRSVWLRRFTVIIAVITVSVAIDACLVGVVLQTILGAPVLPLPAIKIIGHNCGHVYQGDFIGARSGVYDSDQGELCLWRAYTTCHTSTLIVDTIWLETSETDAITIQSTAGHCAVTDTSFVWGLVVS